MRKIVFILGIAIILASCKPIAKKETMKYPPTKKVDTTDIYFGTKVADPYRWLEDDRSEETKAWVKAENKLTQDYLSKIPMRKKIVKRLQKLWNYEKYSSPFKKAGKYFFYKNDGLQNQSVLYVQNSLSDSAKVLLDPNKLSEQGTAALSSVSISDDGKFVAYAVAFGGSDWNEIFIKNIETGELLGDHLKWVKFSSIAWYKNGFFYGRYAEPKGSALSSKNSSQKIYYHQLASKQSTDKLYFESTEDAQRFYSPQTTDDKEFLVLYESESTSGNNLLIKNLKTNKAFVKLDAGFNADFSVIAHKNQQFYILTNYNSPKYKVVTMPDNKIELSALKDLIPESEDVISGVELSDKNLVVEFMHDAQSKLVLYSLTGEKEKEIKLPGIGSVSNINIGKGDDFMFYTFTSFIYPPTIFKYSFSSEKNEIYHQPKLDFNPADYETKQVFYKSKDGTEIPMFITHKKGLKLDGNTPTLLYAYGGFNISLTPSFKIRRLIWLENGYVFAQANLRGGGEYGEKWHKAGIKMKKQNVFDDFIAAAEYLIDNKYTNTKKLTIHGGSNGGLLIGAVTNQRPDLFAVALPAVGVMDMLRYHKFTIGWAWASDYGTSADSKEMFNYLYAYSPVHNVKKGIKYPAILVTTGDHDDRVVPAHSFKYIANLQEKYNGNNPVLIRIETMAGHGAGKPTEKQIQEIADIWSFAFKNMNVEPKY